MKKLFFRASGASRSERVFPGRDPGSKPLLYAALSCALMASVVGAYALIYRGGERPDDARERALPVETRFAVPEEFPPLTAADLIFPPELSGL